MYGRHMKKAPRLLAIRGAAALILVLALSIFPFATVMANTVSANVIDGDQSYTFNMSSTSLEDILAQAGERGMEPLGPLDVAERVEGTTTVVVRRGVELAVSEAGEESQLVAYVGDTVEQALLDNSIVLKDEDEVSPSRDTVIAATPRWKSAGRARWWSSPTARAGTVTRIGGTVQDALDEAGVTVGERDSLNYETDKPLVWTRWHIRVTR